MLLITFFRPTDDVIEIAPERDTYSVLEGNDLEVCIIVLSQSIMIEFEVIVDIYHKCKSPIEDVITAFLLIDIMKLYAISDGVIVQQCMQTVAARSINHSLILYSAAKSG